MIKIILLILTITLPSTSWGLEFSGALSQGGFIIGKVNPGQQVRFSNNLIKTASNGTFVIGIPRLHEVEGKIEVIENGAVVETKSVIIASQEYKIQKITGVPKRKVDPNPEDLKQIKYDKKQILKARNHFSELEHFNEEAIIPTKGRISGVYGSRRFFNGKERSWHKGLDIAAKTGTPVVAPIGGKVRLALANSFFNGNLVVVDHGNRLMTIYAHLDSIAVKEGQKITKGELLGKVGTTGRSTGPHLHWGLYWKNMALNPEHLLTSLYGVN